MFKLKTGGGTIQYPYVALWQSNELLKLDVLPYTSQYSDIKIGSASLTPEIHIIFQ